jgi:hypothetical protein
MVLPFELIEYIYFYSDIDTQLLFHKIFEYHSFRAIKLNIDKQFLRVLENLVSIHCIRYNVRCQLRDLFRNNNNLLEF